MREGEKVFSLWENEDVTIISKITLNDNQQIMSSSSSKQWNRDTGDPVRRRETTPFQYENNKFPNSQPSNQQKKNLPLHNKV